MEVKVHEWTPAIAVLQASRKDEIKDSKPACFLAAKDSGSLAFLSKTLCKALALSSMSLMAFFNDA
jgi:hypothetical protein